MPGLNDYIENNFPAIKLSRGIRTKLPIYYYISGGVFGVYSQNEYISTQPLAAATFVQNTSYPFWTPPGDGSTWQLLYTSYRYTTAAGAAATFGLEVAGTTVAPSSGTAQYSSLMLLNGAANTTFSAAPSTQTLITSATALNLVVSNAQATTSLVGLVITAALQRLS